MDTSEYLPMFLAECREHLQDLNLAVVKLEEASDPETVDEIFRGAHSLKGMSATMGFEGMAHLTHEMENVFELLRQRDAELPAAVCDILLACLDALSAAIDAIDATGAEAIEPAPLIAQLQALVRARDVEHEAEAAAETEAAAAFTPVALKDGERVVLVTATLADGAVMPSVRAFMVLQALSEHGTVVGSDPAESAVDGFSGTVISVTLASGVEDEVLQATAAGVDDVASATVTTPEAEAEAEAVADEAKVVDLAPKAEAKAAAASGGAKSSTVRVDAERLDQLMHFMGELVVQRTHVESLASQADIPGLAQAMQELTRSSHALQGMVMQIRMVPVEAVFMRFPRLVRDVGSKLGKQVDLQIVGQETELDRTVVDALGDPLVHLVRNALDHGLESPEARRAAGKPETGTLTIAARHAGGSIVISVSDDGAGVNPQRVAARAVERGLLTHEQAAAIDVEQAVELLFAPGFSTADVVGDLSGRGVGMDAVRTKIRALGGECIVRSVPGQGTEAHIRLPLTLAIMSALLVEADGRPYGLPLNRVNRTMRLADQVVRSVGGKRMLVVDEAAIPIQSAAEVFGHVEADPAEETHLVLLRAAADQLVALSVSALVGQVELVTRPLPQGVHSGAAISGAAVLSNGDIVLLGDCDAMSPPSTNATRPLALATS